MFNKSVEQIAETKKNHIPTNQISQFVNIKMTRSLTFLTY